MHVTHMSHCRVEFSIADAVLEITNGAFCGPVCEFVPNLSFLYGPVCAPMCACVPHSLAYVCSPVRWEWRDLRDLVDMAYQRADITSLGGKATYMVRGWLASSGWLSATELHLPILLAVKRTKIRGSSCHGATNNMSLYVPEAGFSR